VPGSTRIGVVEGQRHGVGVGMAMGGYRQIPEGTVIQERTALFCLRGVSRTTL
jgi:hypothetical protein